MAKKRSSPSPADQPEFGPAEAAAALKKLHRRLPPPDKSDVVLHRAAAKLVLHWADRVIEACPDPTQWRWGDHDPPTDRTLVTLNRDQLSCAMAALDALNLPKEVWQEIDTAIQATSTIARTLGNLEQALSARKGMPQAHADRVQHGRKRKAEARVALEQEIIKDKKWSPKQGDLPEKLQGELHKPTGKRWSLTTIRRDINPPRATTR